MRQQQGTTQGLGTLHAAPSAGPAQQDVGIDAGSGQQGEWCCV